MKPCAQNQKRIAWLAADTLDADAADELRAHLNICPGCRQYWRELTDICRDHSEAANDLPEVRPSLSFHERLARRIRQEETRRVPVSALEILRQWRLDWRVAISAVALALIVIAALQRPGRYREVPKPAPTAPQIAAARAAIDSQPTFSSYRVAANTSIEALDELLTQQAAHRSWSAQALPVSATRWLVLNSDL